MNSEVKRILEENIEDYPIAHLEYKGTSNKYITWSELYEKPTIIADDKPIYSEIPYDIDVYSTESIADVVEQIISVMTENDWIWVETSQLLYDTETAMYHKIITFTKERMV